MGEWQEDWRLQDAFMQWLVIARYSPLQGKEMVRI
jgi:hypothetical protein